LAKHISHDSSQISAEIVKLKIPQLPKFESRSVVISTSITELLCRKTKSIEETFSGY
jgi:hypothetical protein